MPSTPHIERHFRAPASVRDVVIGMADGLTVPFALAAGLSGAVAATDIIVTAGAAEIAAGAIAMGLGGFLAARTDEHHYRSEYRREWLETEHLPEEERAEVVRILRDQGLEGQPLELVLDAITSDRTRWVNFMMRYELGLEKPEPRRAPISALTIGGSYIVGGLIPLFPYMMTTDMRTALYESIAVTLVSLGVFGAVKGKLTGMPPLTSGLQTLAVGGAAAAAAFLIARLIGGG